MSEQKSLESDNLFFNQKSVSDEQRESLKEDLSFTDSMVPNQKTVEKIKKNGFSHLNFDETIIKEGKNSETKNFNFNGWTNGYFASAPCILYEYATEKTPGYRSSEIYEIFERCETTEIQSVEETGAVLTEYEDILNITNEQENIYIKDEEFIDSNSNDVKLEFTTSCESEKNLKNDILEYKKNYRKLNSKKESEEVCFNYNINERNNLNSDIIPNSRVVNCSNLTLDNEFGVSDYETIILPQCDADSPTTKIAEKPGKQQITYKNSMFQSPQSKGTNQIFFTSETMVTNKTLNDLDKKNMSDIEALLSDYLIIDEHFDKKETYKSEVLIQVR